MKNVSRTVFGVFVIASSAAITGCGDEKIKLQDAPAAQIAPVKTGEATKSKDALKTGAPPKGSSSGMQHNPSETP